MSRKRLVTIVLMTSVASVALTVGGCTRGKQDTLVLATTTSTRDSGLLDVLIPEFERRYDHTVKTIAVGSGEAIKMGQRGDADVVLAHDPAAEERFAGEGYGLQRVKVMYNDYVILGPESDPAGIKGEKSAAEAFKRIADAAGAGRAGFVSRGDGSGTNMAEIDLWKKAGEDPAGRPWYVATGQGMGETLKIADEKQAYSLADRATFISRQGNRLVLLFKGDPALYNQYGVMVVNPAKHPDMKLNAKGAGDFVEFLTSDEGQKAIGEYKLEGVVLFHPNAAGETRGSGD